MANRRHSNEFKQMIVELLQSGQIVKQVSQEYGLNDSMIRKWRTSYELNSVIFPNKAVLTPEQSEIKVLQKELREVKLERDILKKAVSIFSKSDRQGMGLLNPIRASFLLKRCVVA